MGMTDEALGRLAGMWLGHRWNRIQENNAAKALGNMYGYDYDAEKSAQQGTQQAMQQDANSNLWNQIPNVQNNIAQYTHPTNQVAFNLPNNTQENLWQTDLTQYTRPQQSNNNVWQTTQQPTIANGALEANQNLWQTMQKPQQSLLNQSNNNSLWNFTQQPNSGQAFGQFVNPQATSLNGASVNEGRHNQASALPDTHKPLAETNGMGIPDRNAITTNYQRQFGKDVVALVKGGMNLNDAKSYAANRMQSNIDRAYGDYVTKFTDDVLEPMRQEIVNNLMYTTDKDGNTVVDTYNSSKVKGMYGAVTRYNALAQKVGAQPIDMNNLASAAAINKPNFKDTTMPNGHLVRIDGDTGSVQDMGNYGKVSPYGAQNGHILMHDDSGNVKDIGGYGTVRMQQLDDGTTYLVSSDGQKQLVGKFPKFGSGGIGSGGTSGLQAQQLRTLASLHTTWMKQHLDADESESPYYNDLQTALANGVGGGNNAASSDDHANLKGQDKAVADLIDKKRMNGESPEQIKAELEEAFGKGNYYINWIW